MSIYFGRNQMILGKNADFNYECLLFSVLSFLLLVVFIVFYWLFVRYLNTCFMFVPCLFYILPAFGLICLSSLLRFI